MDIVKQPYDKFFKEVFSDSEVMKEFMKNYLPSEILALTDIDTLTLENNSFIDPELKENYSDLLFKTNINKKTGYLYFLFEHKSYLSPYTPLQLLKYMIKIWESKTSKEKSLKLPLIIPLVIYHGKEKWNIDKKFIKMVAGIDELPAEIIKYIPNYEYILNDLTTYETDQLRGNILLIETIKILKAMSQDKDVFLKIVQEILTVLDKQSWNEDYRRYFTTFIIFIISARSDLEMQDIYEAAKNISPERSADIMTIAEKLYKEGMEKGLKKGLEKGLEKGRREGRLEGKLEGLIEGKIKTAKNLLRLGLTPEQVAQGAELSMDEVLQLKKEIEN